MKTVFISVFSSQPLAMLSVPRGVLTQFIEQRKPGTKIVLLSSKLQEEALAPYVAHENVHIEYLPKYEPRAFRQRLFQFFYSYLIFTDTTRILATFGARADAPPAGGNRHLAFVKRAIAGTFGKSTLVRDRLVPFLFRRAFADRPYREVFEKHRPDIVFISNIATFPDIEVVSEAKRQGVATAGFPCNWDHLNKYYIPLKADFLLVQNEIAKGDAVKLHGYRKEQVIPVGFPQFDPYAEKEKYLYPREEFFKNFSIPPNGKVILFISGSAYSQDEPDILRTIVRWIDEGKFGKNTRLMIRPYVILRDRASEEKKYGEFLNNPTVVFNWMKGYDAFEHRRYFMSMLEYADVIISMFSTTAIEAAIFEKPTITIGFDGYQKRPFHQSIVRLEAMTHFKHILDTKSVRVVRSFDELFASIDGYLKNPELDRDKREYLIEKMCYKMDGKASARVAEFVLRTANA